MKLVVSYITCQQIHLNQYFNNIFKDMLDFNEVMESGK